MPMRDDIPRGRIPSHSMTPADPTENDPTTPTPPTGADGDQPTRSVALKMIVVTCFAAVLIGLVAVLFERLEALGSISMAFLKGQSEDGDPLVTGIWTTILPALSVLVAMPLIIWLQRKFFPGTEGTGIPQAIAAIRIGPSPARRFMLSTRIALGKILLLAIALVSGITVGREGPSVHVGACCMHLCTRICRAPSWLMHHGLILAGGAAGIAAAFNTPIAGAIFCIEEIGRTFDRRSMPAILRTVAIACAIGVICLGDYLFYGRGNQAAILPLAWPDGLGFQEWLLSLRPWIAVPVIGVIGGLLGGGFARAVVEGSRRIGPALINRPVRTGLLLGLALAIIGILSNGDSYGGGHSRTIAMLQSAADTGEPSVGWSHPFSTAAASLVALVSAIPGGLFDPSLTVGAGIGQVTHGWFHDWISPGIGLTEVMLLWMSAYFAGVVRSPLTVAAILFEMTGAYGMILPLMLTSMIASLIAGRLCEPSIYDALASQFLRRLGLEDSEASTAGRSPTDAT